jgi:hypothetical protein
VADDGKECDFEVDIEAIPTFHASEVKNGKNSC